MSISLCMIVKDEERCLARCLESVRGLVDQLVLVDTGSSDRTVEIARGWNGPLVIARHEWTDDFAAARNFALQYATGDWVLILDADEWLAPGAADEILRLTAQNHPYTGYELLIRNLTEDGPIEHLALRLFARHADYHYIWPIHEQLASDGVPLVRVVAQNAVIMHDGYLNEVMEPKDKAARNLAIQQRLTESEPEEGFHWFNLARATHVANDVPWAIACLEQAIELAKNVPAYLSSAWVMLLALRVQQGEWDKAANELYEAESVCRFSPDYWVNRGMILAQIGQISDAVDAYTLAWDIGQEPLRTTVRDAGSCTWKPFAGLSNIYAMAGEQGVADLFAQKAEELKDRDYRANCT